MAIVTISSEIGTGARRIGKALASRLGYRFVDREIVGHAAQQYGLVEERLCHLDEERPSFLERFDVETQRNLAVLQTVFYGFAEGNDVVLMGHCGQWLLRGIPHVLRVRLVARLSLRVKRMEATLATQPERKLDPRHATHLVRQRDADKVARVRDLYDVDVRDPALYDLVINDGALTPETVVDLIAAVVGRPEFAGSEPAKQRLGDRALASRVELALLTDPATRHHRIGVDACRGIVTLESTTHLERAIELARSVAGVRDVKVRPLPVPIPTLFA